MDGQAKTRQVSASILAIALWLVTFSLGLLGISFLKGIYYLIYVSLGGSIVQAETFVPWLLLILALIFLVFIIASTEYHLKRVGKPESWRLFGWTIAVELSIILLNYLLY